MREEAEVRDSHGVGGTVLEEPVEVAGEKKTLTGSV